MAGHTPILAHNAAYVFERSCANHNYDYARWDVDTVIKTEGQRAFIDWMAADPARSQGSVARALGVSQPAVGYWAKGTSRPQPQFRAALKALCGIEEGAWELAEERQQRDDALARIAADKTTARPERVTVLDETDKGAA